MNVEQREREGDRERGREEERQRGGKDTKKRERKRQKGRKKQESHAGRVSFFSSSLGDQIKLSQPSPPPDVEDPKPLLLFEVEVEEGVENKDS